jgi:threonine synthase
VTSQLRCGGCGWTTAGVAFRCPRAGHDPGDHVLNPILGDEPWPTSRDPNPFIRYRTLLHAYAVARSRGESDTAWCERVAKLDDRVAAVDGKGFRVTPFRRVGAVAVKDETGGVAGSHKGRHLFGTLLAVPDDRVDELAIASCGNAALAAAVVARAAERRLRVFVPTWAPQDVVRRLGELGAVVEVCPRRSDEIGDPCVVRFRAAVAGGAVPFSCQGTDNGLALDGGRTLGWELADQVADQLADQPAGDVSEHPADEVSGQASNGIDRVVVQVGGGALASSTFRALAEAVARGRWSALPRLHAAQAEGASPLVRAWDRASAVAATVGWTAALDEAAADRARFMRPWDVEPTSAATGILDDETYDWLAILRSVAQSGGSVVAVDEATIAAATTEGRRWVPAVGPTGAAGLAGTRVLERDGLISGGERVAVVFTGRT